MADQHERGFKVLQFAFEPFDRGKIKMIGRLIKHQNVRFWRQHARECRTPRLTA